MRVADVLARALASAEIRYAFGIPGGEILTLIDALESSGIRFVTARHETAAGLMAEGSWLASGAPGLLAVTLGPGLTNAVNAIANAYLDRVPLIVLNAAPEGRFTHQILKQRELLQPIVKASFCISARDARGVVERAIAVALEHPRGPVQIELAPSVARASAAAETSDVPRIPAGQANDDMERLRVATDWLTCAQRPLVLAGLEAADAEVSAALTRLLDRWPAPLITTYKAKGVLSEEDPRCIGALALSPLADDIVAPLIEAADVVLLVGYDPVEMRASYVDPFPSSARVIELTPRARDHAMHAADVECVGPLAPALSHIALQLSAAATELWPDAAPQRVRAKLRSTFTCQPGAGFSPLAVVSVLAELLPASVPLTIDTGAHRILLSQAPIAKQVGQVAQSNGLCTMGYALPSTIGRSLACGGGRVVAAMGDGGLEMVLGELATLRDLQLPITLVVFDDRSLALIDLKQRAAGYASHGVALGASDHVALARAFGGVGERVGERVGFEQALARALARPRGFSLISCAVERGAYAGLI